MVFILPIEHDNPTRHRPFTVWTLVALNVIAFIASMSAAGDVFATYGFRASEPSTLTALTSMFLHAGPWHLLGNMFFLWMFGDNVEDIMGAPKFVTSYFLTGLAAVWLHSVTTSTPAIPLVGASGAVSGVMGMYLVLQPHTRFDLHFILVRWSVKTIQASGLVATAVWFGEQLLLAALTSFAGVAVPIAFWAHVGGFLAGLLAGVLFGRLAIPPSSDRVSLNDRRFDS